MIDKTIYLPDRSHYKLTELARAIADLFPAEPDDSKGIDCIKEKLLLPLESRLFLKDSAKPHYLYSRYFVEKAPLTEEDREILNPILKNPPEITHFMSDEEIELFFDQYYKIPNRPSWEPSITSPAYRQKMKDEYEKRLADHCEYFLSKVKYGTFIALDDKASILSGNEYNARKIAQIPKEDAINYFKLLNLNLVIKNETKSQPTLLNQEYPPEDLRINYQQNPSPTINSKKTRNPKRDLLTQAIEDYQKKHPGDWTTESMWLEFNKMATKNEAPFTSPSKGVINWLNDVNKPVILNLRTLKERIRRQKIKALESQVSQASPPTDVKSTS